MRAIAIGAVVSLGLACGAGVEDAAVGESADALEVVDEARLDRSFKYVFLTSDVYPADFGGLAGADAKCRAAAKAGNLPGRYKAWLSTSRKWPAATFTHSTVPYELPNGTVVADDWADLTDGSLDHAIDANQFAVTILSAQPWTSTKADGTYAGTAGDPSMACDDWTSVESSGVWAVFGDLQYLDARWTASVTVAACPFNWPLYCFQQ